MLMIFSESGALIFGLTRENVARLQQDKPITIDCPRPLNGVEHIMIVFGNDKVELLDKLEVSGLEIPKAVRDDAVLDPL